MEERERGRPGEGETGQSALSPPHPLSLSPLPVEIMSELLSPSDAGHELQPQLLYRVDGDEARFATWELTDGHEALAVFTTVEAATKYRGDLPEAAVWTIYQPPREKLIEILQACRTSGILYAALDPLGGNAKTLFDIPRVLAAVI